jgi:hypothetical protein
VTNMLAGTRANNVSLTCSSTSPGEEEPKARETVGLPQMNGRLPLTPPLSPPL